MNEQTKNKIKEIVSSYNDKYKVKDRMVGALPDSTKFFSTIGGWVRAENDDRYGWIIKLGSGFPISHAHEMFTELEKEFPNITWRAGNYGTNWTPVTPIEKT